MNFNLETDQQLLQDSVRRFVEKACGFQARAEMIAARHTGGGQAWGVFAAQGWLAAALPEAYGGLGGSMLDTVLIAQEFGRGLVIEPYLGCAVLAAQTLAAAAAPAQLEQLLPALADGSRRIALAHSEAGSRGDPAAVALTAVKADGGYRLHGTKTLALGAVGADALIVSARVCGGSEDGSGDGSGENAAGITLLLVDADSPGLAQLPLPLHDGRWAAELQFDGVHVPAAAVLGEPGHGLPALRHGLAHAMAALCAELVGVMEKAIEITADYLKVRQQFGAPIGSFQALQHRMADMAAELEVARSMLYVLLASIRQDNAQARDLTVAQAKALIGRAARTVCAQAIQLHGGIGMTEECPIGHYFRYAVVADILFGSGEWHEAACAGEMAG
ncbi:acyl-CoA dehydrogenase [Cupriavidus necator]|uniref:Acyl-CoA dehydrogenase n=1 Tax=Cupriavidus necator TaxID=106590 RepID=A0A1U9V1P0_CUPNE|nr:acyl-CoA dehydrogenase family protein [Cupriavidus necator]AQV98295.1 acyl-CoA dehydrogenase [Cupriavidus necator]